ncbi:hypothetical protein ABL78_4883 [Leptomonas seymouri]|uniref:GRIP domain-containing protein n=1 Tax=Leptomonas seymouri TaxID=5684 RepID=A0A0N1HXK7_LEPSE|nr:hypothetical protein ABL78_4883 [Leptomonas seymouri]|eukprot:KPI86045.1 hypothetical protein ABL78_4883 [Leptomonas seymouri]
MWKEWTKKIKTFAEDITSPDYDEEGSEGKADDEAAEESYRCNNSGDPYDSHAPHGRTAAPERGSREAYGMQGDGASLLVETPVRSLDKHYDEPTVERQPAMKLSAAPPPHPPVASLQPFPATSAATVPHAPAAVGHNLNKFDAASDESSHPLLSLSKPAPTAEKDDVHAGGSALTTSMRLLADGSPRRGPPMAMATPQHQQQHPRTPFQASAPSSPVAAVAATNAATSSFQLSSSNPAGTTARAEPTSATADVPSAPPPEARDTSNSAARQDRSDAFTPPTGRAASSMLASQQQRNAELEAEKAQMLRDIHDYQEEVRVSHEQTVAYYEAQLSRAHQEASDAVSKAERLQEQLESSKEALRIASEERRCAQAANKTLEQKVKLLEQETGEMKATIADLQAKLNAVPAVSHTDAEWAQMVQECAELKTRLLQQASEQRAAQTQLEKTAEAERQSLEAQLREARSQLASLQATTAASKQQQHGPEPPMLVGQEKAATLQAPLDSWGRRAEEGEDGLAGTQKQRNDVMQQLAEEGDEHVGVAPSTSPSLSPVSVEEAAQLRRQLQTAEAARRTLEVQLQEAQSELTSTLALIKQQRSTEHQAEELEAVTLELESARQRAEALEQELTAAKTQKASLASQLAVGSSAAASSCLPADEAKQLSQKLHASVEQCNSFKREVQECRHTMDELTNRMKAEEKAYREARAQLEEDHAEAEAALENELAETRATAAQRQQKLEEQLCKLQVELQQAHKCSAQAVEEISAASKARAEAEDMASSAMLHTATLEKERASLQQQLQQCRSDLAEQQQAQRRQLAEKETDSSISISLAALTSIKRELEDRVQSLELTADQVRRMTVDTLTRLGVDVTQAMQQHHKSGGDALHRGAPPPPPAHRESTKDDMSANSRRSSSSSRSSELDSNDGEEEESYADEGRRETVRQRKAHDQLPLLQLFSLLITECMQQHSIVLRAERVQREWEQTYEQARQINESLNQQIAESWTTIGKLREEVSVKDATVRQMQSRVGTGDTRLLELQEELTRSTAEVQQLREEREAWKVRLQQSEVDAETQEQTLASLHEELQSLQLMLQSKDEELLSSKQSVENLQIVLERFQETKRNEVEALTLESQLEAENLKRELEERRRTMEQHEQAKVALRESYGAQLAAKDAEVTTLYRKLAEVRKVLEKTASHSMEGTETSVDKRIVSQLLAKYIHAFMEQRKEAEDMLKVLSGLLDWDEATQELAGLLPGPNNPRPPGSGPDGQVRSGGGGIGLFGWRRRKAANPSSGTAAVGQGSGGGGSPSTSKSGLASMWVEFLLKESESRSEDAAAGALPTPSTPAGGPVSAAAVPPGASTAARGEQ